MTKRDEIEYYINNEDPDAPEFDLEIENDGRNISFTEPYNNAKVKMATDGLRSLVLNIKRDNTVYIIGNYTDDKLSALCCVSCGSTTACGSSVCLDCDGFEVCCGQ